MILRIKDLHLARLEPILLLRGDSVLVQISKFSVLITTAEKFVYVIDQSGGVQTTTDLNYLAVLIIFVCVDAQYYRCRMFRSLLR